ncbi:hypothetical protein MWU58_13880 [Flavobacteriaceae bacterium S0825]|uniref:hypothetical protein n=1 Tax=Gaetbulibacter sp. S0825 TaxID=2720084 RepID=UPI0014301F98|nr:hypothetical protein [Gaetbulibacter sp. S0825]MCK0110387.1 hypothetical protein [Flavobacteriaceae bacterium S0825]NIX66016.1 hypothetical protein [Gaetbulibacter sp. S0825]
MRPSFLFLYIILLITTSCNSNKISLEPPLVDGKYDDYVRLGVEPIALSDDVNLYIYQNEHYVWLAYNYPEGSFGTLDLEIDSESLDTPLNLHVSAQLGEWEIGNDEQQPKDSTSDLWWEIDGWTSNVVWLNGMDRTGDEPQINFKNAECREIQISKSRFGKGIWRLKFNIRAIVGGNGERYEINYPENDAYYNLEVS